MGGNVNNSWRQHRQRTYPIMAACKVQSLCVEQRSAAAGATETNIGLLEHGPGHSTLLACNLTCCKPYASAALVHPATPTPPTMHYTHSWSERSPAMHCPRRASACLARFPRRASRCTTSRPPQAAAAAAAPLAALLLRRTRRRAHRFSASTSSSAPCAKRWLLHRMPRTAQALHSAAQRAAAAQT